MILIFPDPCKDNPCKENSKCVKESSTDYKCECNTNYVPKNGNATKYGCKFYL